MMDDRVHQKRKFLPKFLKSYVWFRLVVCKIQVSHWTFLSRADSKSKFCPCCWERWVLGCMLFTVFYGYGTLNVVTSDLRLTRSLIYRAMKEILDSPTPIVFAGHWDWRCGRRRRGQTLFKFKKMLKFYFRLVMRAQLWLNLPGASTRTPSQRWISPRCTRR